MNDLTDSGSRVEKKIFSETKMSIININWMFVISSRNHKFLNAYAILKQDIIPVKISSGTTR